MSPPVVVAYGLLGLATGSYLNVLIVRWIGWRLVLPPLLGFESPYSVVWRTMPGCQQCGAPLGLGPVAVVPWVLRLGRCRRCRTRLSLQHLAVEVVTAGLFAVGAARIETWEVLIPVLVLFAFLVAVSTVDIVVQRIPTRFVYTTLLASIVLIVAASLRLHVPRAIVGAGIGAAFYFGFLFLFHLISPRRMGFGDVRLAGVAGLYVGWLGWSSEFPVLGPLSTVIWAALVGSLVGTIVGLGVIVVSRRNRYFPFGPALATGTVIVVLFADRFRP